MRITSCVRREVRLELWQVVHVSRFWPTSTSAAPVSGSMNTTAVVHQEVALSVAVGAGHEDGVGDPVAEAAKQEVQEGHACLASRATQQGKARRGTSPTCHAQSLVTVGHPVGAEDQGSQVVRRPGRWVASLGCS